MCAECNARSSTYSYGSPCFQRFFTPVPLYYLPWLPRINPMLIHPYLPNVVPNHERFSTIKTISRFDYQGSIPCYSIHTLSMLVQLLKVGISSKIIWDVITMTKNTNLKSQFFHIYWILSYIPPNPNYSPHFSLLSSKSFQPTTSSNLL